MKNRLENRQKIICMMSGGIDSSTAAALLKESGDFDVIGVFMRLWPKGYSKAAENRARSVALKLGIPFRIFDFEKEFKKKIVDCFLQKNKEGLTPNPCVVCNKEIKFGILLRKARQMGVRFIATGHYARIEQEKEGIVLMRGRDKNKDQSYFLWKLSQNQLKHILFPVGGYKKSEVRDISKKFKFPVSNFQESQEICFIKDKTPVFLRKFLKSKPGKIIDNSTGKTLGFHEGLWFYTIGQRRNIKLPGGPFYVLEKDLKKNLLIIGKNEKDLYKSEAFLKDVNWISGKKPKLPLRAKVKIRYGHKASGAVISKMQNKKYKVKFKRAQRALTPGQSAVFYKGSQILGGGVISS